MNVLICDPISPKGIEYFRQQPQLKIILKLSGCAADDLDADLLSRADAIFPSELPQAEIIAKLSRII